MREIPIPQTLADLLAEPQRVRDAIALLNALAGLEVHLVPASTGATIGPGKKAILGDAPSLVLALPLGFSKRISAPSGGSVVDAECRAVLTALLGEHTATKQNP